MRQFGIYIIGDEILSGKRQDAHLSKVISLLSARGLQLSWAHFIGDIPEQITGLLKASMARGDVVFSFGGIGATPDDYTRQCAAAAAGVPIERHAGAVANIEAQYGAAAYPKRVLMADFPQGCALIPNPVNRVAGFSLHEHYFVPGFPEMAHPMVEWVLETYYSHLFHRQDYLEQAIVVTEAGESDLIDLMNSMLSQYPMLKLFSLPRTNQRRTTEVGLKGESAFVLQAMQELKAGVSALGYPWVDVQALMECRPHCGACCIAPSINSPIPGMPHGKPAGVPCIQLDDQLRCKLFGKPERPAFCGGLQPAIDMCGESREQAITWLSWLEAETQPR